MFGTTERPAGTLKISDFPCVVCGRPATHFHRDADEREPLAGEEPGYRYFEPGETTFGCDEHPRS